MYRACPSGRCSHERCLAPTKCKRISVNQIKAVTPAPGMPAVHFGDAQASASARPVSYFAAPDSLLDTRCIDRRAAGKFFHSSFASIRCPDPRAGHDAASVVRVTQTAGCRGSAPRRPP